MDIIQAIILGFIQGVAEFLPISSSGHLKIMQDLLNVGEIPILFDVLLHIPTLLVVLIVFRKTVFSVINSIILFIQKKNTQEDEENLQLFKLAFIASIATGIVGIGIKFFMDAYPPNSQMVGILFLVTATILIASKFFKGSSNYSSFGPLKAFLTGLAQGIGVLPGISRSGITISASVIAGMDRKKAGEYSFLISIPAILAATALEARDINALNVGIEALAAGMITSFIVGWISLILLLKLIQSGKFYLFSIYLIPMGIYSIFFV